VLRELLHVAPCRAVDDALSADVVAGTVAILVDGEAREIQRAAEHVVVQRSAGKDVSQLALTLGERAQCQARHDGLGAQPLEAACQAGFLHCKIMTPVGVAVLKAAQVLFFIWRRYFIRGLH
jgi:hypothetical protein